MRGLLIAVAALLLTAPAARAACADPCAYTGVGAIGERAGGQLRLPQAVAVDAAGRVFVGDQYTGAIQRFGPGGDFQLAFGAPGAKDGEFGAIVGLAIDPADGSLYAADAVNDRIQHFTADGAFIGAFGTNGSGPGQFLFGKGSHVELPAQGGVAVGAGRVWVADARNDRVQSFPLDDVRGAAPSVANAQVIGAGVLDNPQGLWASDKLYVADDLHNVIRVFALGDGALLQTIGLGGPGDQPGQFNGAWDVAAGPDGRVYAVDDNNHRIQVFDAGGALVGGWGSFGRDPGQLEYPRAATLGPDGFLYVANTADGRVDKFTTAGAYVQSFGQDGRLPGQFIAPGYLAASPDGGLGVPDIEGNRIEQFAPDGSLLGAYGGVGSNPDRVSHPQGIAFDAGFDAWVADTDNDRIVRRGFYGSTVSVLDTPGQFDAPLGVAVDATALFVADSKNDRVLKLGLDGVEQRVYGPSFDLGLSQELDSPRGVALNPVNGLLYVASGQNDRVLAIEPLTGARQWTFGGTGTAPGKFDTPGGIAIDAAGRVYVADIGNDRVQRFSPEGIFQVAWGEEGTELGQFEHPVGIAADCAGGVAVADQDNNRVQRFTLADARAGTCAATPARPEPVAPPPPPETPAPVPQAPKVVPQLTLTVKKLRATRALARRALRVSVRCDRRCSVKLAGTLAPAAGRRRPRRALHGASLTLAAGKRRDVSLRLTARDVRVLRRALGRRRTALRLVVRASATAKDAKPASLTRALRATR